MKYLLSLVLLCAFCKCKAQDDLQLFRNNLDSADRYNKLMECSKKCTPDSTRYYRGRFYFYTSEVAYYASFIWGPDYVRKIWKDSEYDHSKVIFPVCNCH